MHFSDSLLAPTTLVELLCQKALQYPERRAFTFLNDGEQGGDHPSYLTYHYLDCRARAIAALLQQRTTPGDRVLLVYPPGLEFISAFFGCLYSGVIAVPAYPPQTRAKRGQAKLQAIAHDIQPSAVLLTSSISTTVEGLFADAPALQATPLIATDHIDDELAVSWRNPQISSDTLAFLQYTSGSTGTPKGVMLTHGNLMYNLALIHHSFESSADIHSVIWLPLYHDMGLIGGILGSIHCGCRSTLMSPVAFLQRPIRWLQAISHTSNTSSGGPDFAYDLCVRKITAEQKATLDLSGWEVAFNGAETIRKETMQRFVEAFAPCGFRREAFYPCYGLAEASLLVAAGQKSAAPVVRTFQAAPLEQNLVIEAFTENAGTRSLVECGHTMPGQKIIIVNPTTLISCPPNQVGEVWISGPSIAQGYWQKPAETEYTFHAYLTDSGEGPFLRTGDLGFLKDGGLFITGRLKDLIIIRGRNHYPQDIERTVAHCHPALRRDGGAAFSVDALDEERLVIVQEVDRQYRNLKVDEVVGAIRQAVAEEHELQVYAIVLVTTGSVPKTSSGKTQRSLCKERFLARNLNVMGEWMQRLESGELHASVGARVEGLGGVGLYGRPPSADTDNGRTGAHKKSPNAEAKPAGTIQTWLVAQISERLKIAPQNIDVREPLVYYGMDSASAVSLAGDLEVWLDRRLPSTLAYDYPTIEAISRYLGGEPPIQENHHVHVPEIFDSGNAELLLAQLGQLSDDEVDVLLKDILQEGASE